MKLEELLKEKGINIKIKRWSEVAGQPYIITEGQEQIKDFKAIDEGVLLTEGNETIFVPLSAILEVKITSA